MKKTTKNSVKLNAAELGRLGGKAVAKAKGKAYMRKIAKRGADARWGKSKKK